MMAYEKWWIFETVGLKALDCDCLGTMPVRVIQQRGYDFRITISLSM